MRVMKKKIAPATASSANRTNAASATISTTEESPFPSEVFGVNTPVEVGVAATVGVALRHVKLGAHLNRRLHPLWRARERMQHLVANIRRTRLVCQGNPTALIGRERCQVARYPLPIGYAERDVTRTDKILSDDAHQRTSGCRRGAECQRRW